MDDFYKKIKFNPICSTIPDSQWERIELILQNCRPEMEYHDVNDILELYNVSLILEKRISKAPWDNEKRKTNLQKKESVKKIITDYFNDLSQTRMMEILSSLNYLYDEDFWNVLTDFELYKNVPKNLFFEILSQKKVAFRTILCNSTLVKHFGYEIKKHLLDEVENAEILIEHYFRKDSKQTYLPSELSDSDCVKILEKYVEYSNAHPSYLELIENSLDKKIISNELRLQAKKNRNIQLQKLTKGKFSTYGVQITFDPSLKEKTVESVEENNTLWHIRYSSKFIKTHNDYFSLLENFRGLFKFNDQRNCCDLVSYKSELGFFSSLLGTKGRNDYAVSVQFNLKDMKSLLEIRGYENELRKMGKSIEGLLSWYFSEFIPLEYGISGFDFTPINPDFPTNVKCKLIAGAFDEVLNQFNIFCKKKFVDKELLNVGSCIPNFENIPSLFNVKYAYIGSQSMRNILFNLFNISPFLKDNKKITSDCNCYFDVFLKYNLSPSEIDDFHKSIIDDFLANNVILLNKSNHYKLTSFALLFQELWEKENIRLLCNDENDALFLGHLIQKKDLIAESTLLSKTEADYFDFMLNRRQFGNGPELRNRYIHGNAYYGAWKMENDYYEMLKLLVVVILKLDEEFAYWSSCKKQE